METPSGLKKGVHAENILYSDVENSVTAIIVTRFNFVICKHCNSDRHSYYTGGVHDHWKPIFHICSTSWYSTRQFWN